MTGAGAKSASAADLDNAPNAVLADLWSQTPFSAEALTHADLQGSRTAPSSFKVAEVAQATIAGAALAASEFHRLHGGRAQTVGADREKALVEFHSESYLRVDGAPAGEIRDPLSRLFRTSDGWVRVHANFPHHRDGVLALLGCRNSVADVGAALLGRRALDVEDEAAERGLCVAAMRSFEEWDRHPHGAFVRAQPLVSVEMVGEAPLRPPPPGERPLSGIRVLDLTRIISGPVAARTLAVHGADVLHVTSPHLPAIPALDIDTGRGKKACGIDLAAPGGAETLSRLLAGADVFLQSYRPGSLDRFGFSWEDVVRARPGVICASLSAYGEDGPWGGRRGFDSLVQTATGFNRAEGDALSPGLPRPLPVQALDHATGYIMAMGVIAALHARARLGGSWRVRTSLARTGLWLRSLGRSTEIGPALPKRGEIDAMREEMMSPFGLLSFVGHAATMSDTPPHWTLPSVPLDTSPAAWW